MSKVPLQVSVRLTARMRHGIRAAGVGALLLLLGLGGGRAWAGDTLRCNTDLVTRGLLLVEVVERCGPPYFEYQHLDYREPGYYVQVDEWLYDLGSNRFRRLLRFENGRLVDIETRGKPRRKF